MLSQWEAVLRADAEDVARRTLRYKFGKLSNRRILATLKAAIDGNAPLDVDDQALLERWFDEYGSALNRLRTMGRPEAVTH
jgi:hypothetical protein